MKKTIAIIVLISSALCNVGCGLIYTVEGTYYYNPWSASVDSEGCMTVDSNFDGRADQSLKYILTLANGVMTITKEGFSDTICTTLDSTIVATSNYTTGAYIGSTRIYYDSSTAEYKEWSAEPVQALEMDITYDTAKLTCKTAACVTKYTMLIAANGCTGAATPVIDRETDYAACEFKDQPATMYTLAYKSNFNEIIFGTKNALEADSVSEYTGDTTVDRHHYLLANTRYSTK